MKCQKTYKTGHILITAFMLLFSLVTQAQSLKYDLAKAKMEQFDYLTAAEIYGDILEKKPEEYTALKNAAVCYIKLQKSNEAENLLLRIDSLKLAAPEDLLLLAQALKSNKKYDTALLIYEKYSTLFPGNPLVRKYLANTDWAHKINRDSALFDIKNSKINSKYSDFAPCFFDKTVLFTSARGGESLGSSTYSWNQQPYLNIYKAELTLDSNLINPSSIKSDINSRVHEGTVTFYPTERALYITRNNYLKGSKKKDNEGFLNLGIYRTRDFNGEFEKLVPFPYNNSEYSVGHPSISKDGLTLYFSSDMPKGYGGTDLYKCEWDGAEWGEPKNLGPEINTLGNEMFPHIFENTLYFSSDGHIGLGGLDIHSVDISNTEARVSNAGYPLNSSYDDFSIIISPNGKSGFFASNRPGGIGDDDIYKFYISRPKFITISGIVTDEETTYPIPEATIFLRGDTDPNAINAVATTNEKGEYTFTAPYQEVFELLASKKGFFEGKRKVASSPTTSFIDNVDIQLRKYDYLAEGHVILADDGTPVKGAKLTLTDENGAVILEKITSEDGYYSFGLYKDKVYKIACEKKDYALQSVSCDTRNRKSTVFQHDFKMFKLEVGVTVKLDNIYYDYNKADIRPDAAVELDKLISILQENPSMKIELSSHTDSRGTSAYNESLSRKRAKSAVDYIISKGIGTSRLQSKGYGESKPINHCRDGVPCTDEEYQLNRRTEFTILEI